MYTHIQKFIHTSLFVVTVGFGIVSISSHAEEESDLMESMEKIRWWQDWQDPQCVQFIEEGLRNSPDSQMVYARLEQAEAIAVQMRAAFLPSLGVSFTSNSQPIEALGFGFGLSNLSSMIPSGSDATTSSVFTSATSAVTLSVPLDIWGTGITAYQASNKDAKATEWDSINSMRMLSFSIANAYYDVLAIEQQQVVVTEQLRLGTILFNIIEMRQQRDDATALDVLQQKQQLNTLQTQQIKIEQQLVLAKQRLSVLLGTSPTRSIAVATTFPTINLYARQDIEKLLRERPDIQAAETRLEAAYKRRYSTLTKMLPSVGVSGKVSRQSNYKGDSWNSLDSWALSSSVNLSLFQGGSKWAALESADAAVVIAEENLRKTKLQAEQELEQSVVNEEQQRRLLLLAQEQLETAQLTYEQAQRMYEKALVPFITVLNTQQSYQQASLNLLQTQRDTVRVRMQTMQALGVAE